MISELKPFSQEECKKLLADMGAYFSKKGIFIDLGKTAKTNNVIVTDEVSSGDFDQFLIAEEEAAPAFFLQINGISDIENCVRSLAGDLDSLHEVIANYAEQNSLEEDVRKKITLINVQISRAKGALSSRGKKLVNDCREKNSVEEQRREAANVFGKVLKERFLEGAMDPIYTERKNVYDFVLQEMNKFLAKWGVQTLPLKVGNLMNYELPCDIIPGSEVGTAEQHDRIREIHRLPYVWCEDREDKLPIWNGQVSVWR